MAVSVRVFASTAPAVALVLGFLLVFAGISAGSSEMVMAGWGFVAVGVFLQLAYLVSRYRVSRSPEYRNR